MKKKFVLALGGGGARALAHIGVYKVLKENKIKIKAVAGTSMGSLIGALISMNKEPEEIYGIFERFLKEKSYIISGLPKLIKYQARTPLSVITRNIKQRILLNLSINTVGLFSSDRIRYFIEKFIDEKNIEELPIPFIAIAADLLTGEIYCFREGNLYPALISSASIPGFFKPFPYEGKLLVDGGLIEEVPSSSARKYFGDPVLCVDVSQPLLPMTGKENLVDLTYRFLNICLKSLREAKLKDEEYLIKVNFKDCEWYEFEKLDLLAKAGELAAHKFFDERF
jgi:NTE family protein